MNYTTSKPSVSSSGNSAYFTIYFEDDTYMEVEVDLTWNSRTDEIEIEKIGGSLYDEDNDILSTEHLDLEDIVIDTFEDYNIFGKAESLMAQTYKDGHDE